MPERATATRAPRGARFQRHFLAIAGEAPPGPRVALGLSMNSQRFFIPGTVAVVALATALTAGCIGGSGSGGGSGNGNVGVDSGTSSFDAGCGVGPLLDQDGGVAYVDDAGVVTFETVSVGSEVDFRVAVKDSADVSETITGATLAGTGAGAFSVLSSFPIDVPKGQPVVVDVRFAPQAMGSYTAQLILQTAKMGPSPVALRGTGGE